MIVWRQLPPLQVRRALENFFFSEGGSFFLTIRDTRNTGCFILADRNGTDQTHRGIFGQYRRTSVVRTIQARLGHDIGV